MDRLSHSTTWTLTPSKASPRCGWLSTGSRLPPICWAESRTRWRRPISREAAPPSPSETNDVADGSAAHTVHVFSELFECRDCRIQYEVPEPRLFSFNNPFGACPTCHGFGNIIELDLDLVVPDVSKSIQQDAIEPWEQAPLQIAAGRLEKGRARPGRADGRPVVRLNR